MNIHHDWVDISPYWEKISNASNLRNKQKSGYASSKDFGQDGHFVGLIGEQLIELLTGIEADWTLRAEGDGGSDFNGNVDIKTATFYSDPDLKQLVNAKHWPDYFVLVAVDLKGKRARLCGYCSKDELLEKNQIKNYGYEDNYIMKAHQLHEGLPEAMFSELSATF